MGNNLIPLYYAILKHFTNANEDDAEGVVKSLAPKYEGYKLLNRKDVEEALATAKENGLLDEASCELDTGESLRIRYRMNDFGRDMVRRYI